MQKQLLKAAITAKRPDVIKFLLVKKNVNVAYNNFKQVITDHKNE